MVRFIQNAHGNQTPVEAAFLKNPYWIVSPCHRVVGHSGKSVGFAGGLDTKRHWIELVKNRAIG